MNYCADYQKTADRTTCQRSFHSNVYQQHSSCGESYPKNFIIQYGVPRVDQPFNEHECSIGTVFLQAEFRKVNQGREIPSMCVTQVKFE